MQASLSQASLSQASLSTGGPIRPDFSRLYGLTHSLDGSPVVRVPRTVKVAIGQPAGRDIHVYINAKGLWTVSIGDYSSGKRIAGVKPFQLRKDAEKYYREMRTKAPERNYPLKLAYFTFSRAGGDGVLEPDFDAIERHGPLPTEIDIVFTDDRPFDAAYEMWSLVGLQCHGDGINAERLVSLATPEEKKCCEPGARFFPITEACYTRDCPYSKPTQRGNKEQPPECKPHGRLSFQMLNDIRLGGKASYDTTGYRTISQLFSSIRELMTFTGGGDASRGYIAGIPLKMVVRPFKTNHTGLDGQTHPGQAFAVKLEFRAESVQGLRQRLLEHAKEFRAALELPAAPVTEVRQIAAPVDESADDDTPDAAAMVAEFAYPEDGPVEEADTDYGDPEPQPATANQQAQAATESATSALKAKLRGSKAAKTGSGSTATTVERPQSPAPVNQAATERADIPAPPPPVPPELEELRKKQNASTASPAAPLPEEGSFF